MRSAHFIARHTFVQSFGGGFNVGLSIWWVVLQLCSLVDPPPLDGATRVSVVF